MLYVVVAILIVVIFLWLIGRSKSKYYKKIFSPDHYQQIGEWVVKMLQVGQVEKPSIEDGTAIVTAAGVAVGFTRQIDNDTDQLHFSVSQIQGYTTHAVGERLLFFIIQLLKSNASRAHCFYTKSTVHHIVLEKDTLPENDTAQNWSVSSVAEAISQMENFSPPPIEFQET